MKYSLRTLTLNPQQTQVFIQSGKISRKKEQFHTIYQTTDPIHPKTDKRDSLKNHQIEHLYHNYIHLYRLPNIGANFYDGETVARCLYHVYTTDCYKQKEEVALTFQEFCSVMEDITNSITPHQFDFEGADRLDTMDKLLQGERKLRYAGLISESVERVLDREHCLKEQAETIDAIVSLFYRREALERAWIQGLIDNIITPRDALKFYIIFFSMNQAGIGMYADFKYHEFGFHEARSSLIFDSAKSYLLEYTEKNPEERWEPNYKELATDLLTLQQRKYRERRKEQKYNIQEEGDTTQKSRKGELSQSTLRDGFEEENFLHRIRQGYSRLLAQA